jgi:hypothetical protein
MSTSQGRQEQRSPAVVTATYVLLFVLGVLQGLIGSFQFSQSPAPLIAILLVVVIFLTCVLGAWGTRSITGAVLPAAGWILTSFLISMGDPARGTVIITATQAGEWYLYGGVVAGLAGVFVSWTFSRGTPPGTRPARLLSDVAGQVEAEHAVHGRERLELHAVRHAVVILKIQQDRHRRGRVQVVLERRADRGSVRP